MAGTGTRVVVGNAGRQLRLTNLDKVFFPALRLTKGDLLTYYLRIAPVLVPHLRDRPMVLRRYPDGAEGSAFFMKRVPTPRPEWLETYRVRHEHRRDAKIVREQVALGEPEHRKEDLVEVGEP